MKQLIPWRLHRGEVSVRNVFDDFFGGRDDFPVGAASRVFGGGTPKVDVYDVGDELCIDAELPGVDEKDLDVNLTDGTVVLSGEKRAEHEVERGGYYTMERSYGSFRRVIALPCEVDETNIKATLENGLLRIRLAKAARARSVDIRVESGD